MSEKPGRWIDRWRLLVALVACLSLFGCAGTAGEDSSAGRSEVAPQPETSKASEAPGPPDDGGNGHEARGAPITMPAWSQRGIPLGDTSISGDGTTLLQSFENDLKAACGGELCVEVQVEPADADLATCAFDHTRPEGGASVDREKTVVIVCNPRPEETQPPEVTEPTPST